MSEFKIIIISPNGVRQSEPVGVSDLSINANLDENDSIFYYMRRISGDLTFVGDDYKHLKNWNQSNKRYEKCTIAIYEIINGVDVEVVRVIISPDEVRWNDDLCNCIVPIDKASSKFDAYDRIKDIPQNIFEVASVFGTWRIGPLPVAPLPDTVTVNNGLYMLEVIEGMLRTGYGANMIIKSKFFNWNDTRLVTIGHENLIHDLVTGSISDIIYRPSNAPSASPATVAMIKLSELLDTFCTMFNLKCDIEGTTVFRIEHISTFDTIVGDIHDLTTADNLILNDGRLNSYEYDNSARYREEQFNNYEKGPHPALWSYDFTAAPIVFNAPNNNKVKTTDSKLATALFYIDSIEGNFEDGIFLAAINNNTECFKLSASGGNQRMNDMLSWGYLAQDYHKLNKSYPTGKIYDTATATVVNTTFGTKQFLVQRRVRIPSDNFKIWLDEQVKTPIGIGRVKKYTKKLGECYAYLDVYFDDIQTNTYAIPFAASDTYTFNTASFSVLDTSAQSLSTLVSNDTPSTALVLAETKKTSAGGTVVISSNGHFVYNRPAGYLGDDTFDYHIINNGLVGTGTCTINIT